MGLPLTSGPIVFFLALDHGAAFAAGAAAGALAGALAEAAFCLAYRWLAFRCRWPVALLGSCLAFAAASAALQRVALATVPLFLCVVAALGLALRLMPGRLPAAVGAPLPRWDIPARMVVATAVVVLLTSAAPALGSRLSGLLATFPLFAAILTVFAHHLEGPVPAVGVLRGLLLGLFAFAGFFLVLRALLERAGIAAAFVAAIAVALALHAGALRALRREAASASRTPSPI